MGKNNQKVENSSSIYTPKTPKKTKRIAAWIVDIILIIIVATGIALFTSLIYGYDDYNNKCYEKNIEYGIYVEDPTGEIEFDDKKYVVYNELEGSTEEEYLKRIEERNKDVEFREAYSKMSAGQVLIVTSGIVGSVMIFELIIPLCLKHGRTIGMKFFDIGYVTDEGIDVDFKTVFIRFLFGKLVVGGLIPYSGLMLALLMPTQYTLVGLVALIGVPVLNLILLFTTPEQRGIHDFIAKCIPVDNTCQIYFKTTEELTKAKAEEEAHKNEKKYY